MPAAHVRGHGRDLDIKAIEISNLFGLFFRPPGSRFSTDVSKLPRQTRLLESI
jgi:hypothetical protein